MLGHSAAIPTRSVGFESQFPAGRWDSEDPISTISGTALLGPLPPFLPGGFQPLPSSRSRCYQDNARIEAHFGFTSVVLKTAMCSADICRQVVFVLSCVVLSRVLAVHTDIRCVVLCYVVLTVGQLPGCFVLKYVVRLLFL